MQLIGSNLDGICIERVDSKVLDASVARAFDAAMKTKIAGGARIVLDLSSVEFIDSTGLGALVSSLRQAHASGGEIKLTGLTSSARALFELVRMHRVFEIFNSSDEAVASYK